MTGSAKQSRVVCAASGLLRPFAPRNEGGRGSVVIPRDADRMGDVVIAGGQLHAGAGCMLADRLAVELLPGRLVGRVGVTALGLQLRAAALQLLVRDQDVGAALVEIDADLVAGLEDRKPTIGGRFRTRIQDRG